MGFGPRGALVALQVVWGALVHEALVFPLLALLVVRAGSQHYPGDYYPDYPALLCSPSLLLPLSL